MPDIVSVFYLQCSLVVLALVVGWGCWRKIVSAEAKIAGTIQALYNKLETLSTKIRVIQTAQVTYVEQVRDGVTANREFLADGIKTLSGLSLKILNSGNEMQTRVRDEVEKVLESQSELNSEFTAILRSIQSSVQDSIVATDEATKTVILHIEKERKGTRRMISENAACLTSVLQGLEQQIECVVTMKDLIERSLKDLAQQEKILVGVANSHTLMVRNLKDTFETSGRIFNEIGPLLETSKGVMQLLKLLLLDSLVTKKPVKGGTRQGASRLESDD